MARIPKAPQKAGTAAPPSDRIDPTEPEPHLAEVVTNHRPPRPKGWNGGPVDHKKVRRYTPAEVAEHIAYVEQLVSTPGMNTNTAVRMTRAKFGFGHGRYLNLKRRIYTLWETEAAEDATANRALAIRRIMQMLNHARGVQKIVNNQSVWERAPNHQAVARYEDLLTRLQGTNVPIEVNLNHRIGSALVEVIGNLTADQVDAALERTREDRRLADEYRRMLPPAAE